jgi:hypothetical protein
MSTELQLEPAAHPSALNASASKIRFAWILPLGELVLSAILLWPIRWIIFQALHIPLPRVIELTMQSDYFRWASHRHFLLTSVWGLNFPALLIQLPYIIVSPEKREWMPAGMDFQIWRAITLPFLCLPFWWIAGRAIDALIAIQYNRLNPLIRWIEMMVGSVWLVIGLALFIGFLFSPSADKDADLTRFAACGGLWAMIGALSVIAGFRQRRLRKKAAQALRSATQSA